MGIAPTSGRAGTAAEPPAQDMGNSPTSGRAGMAAEPPAQDMGNRPTSGCAGTAAEPPAQDMGNSPTSGVPERQPGRRRQLWETALLPGVRNGSRAAGASHGKPPYFRVRRNGS